MTDNDNERDPRRQLLRTPCPTCGQASGWLCVTAGGSEVTSIHRQHAARYTHARVRRGELRALLVKAGLV